FSGKHGSDLPKAQRLRLHCHLYPLVSPPLFETILSNGEMNLKVQMITYLPALACIIIQFPDMSSRAGPASPARPETAYNPDNRSSKNISSCEWICPQSCRCPVHFFVISIMARYSIFRRLSSEGNTVLDFVTFRS